ncbi:MAG: proline/glycine betaine ABC transporter permease [Lentisphaerae bacterium]|nr:proline/glycine betaine ABC transporter permease [Lentisphaerota bacterium]
MFHIGPYFENLINWLKDSFPAFFNGISNGVGAFIGGFEDLLGWPPAWLMIGLLTLLAWWACGWRNWGLAVFTAAGFTLVLAMELWGDTMQTLALVLTSTLLALLIGVPMGIYSGRSRRGEQIVRPILDFMQTMPAFVYLIPAVLFFQLGKVPGAMATVIFAMPPCVRLTTLGLRQVPREAVEASDAFGCTPWQQLMKVQLPMALPSILAGVNQTIMLALSMVVIAAMIGAGGLGDKVMRGITQLKIGMGFEAGLAIVILAMYLDRVTHALGSRSKQRQGG